MSNVIDISDTQSENRRNPLEKDLNITEYEKKIRFANGIVEGLTGEVNLSYQDVNDS